MTLKLLYIGLTVLTALLLILIARTAINKTFAPELRLKKLMLVTIGITAWITYTFIIANSGIIRTYDLPPKLALFLIIPAFVFSAFFIRSNKDNAWIGNLPIKLMTGFQSFRIIVETLFVLSIAKGILHENVTIEGYNYDMILGLSAPIMTYLIYLNFKKYKRLLIIWNYLGIAVLVCVIFVFVSTIYFPHIYGLPEKCMPLEFTDAPYAIVASFLMPSAIFIHALSLVHINKMKS